MYFRNCYPTRRLACLLTEKNKTPDTAIHTFDIPIRLKQKDDNYNYYKAGDIAAGFSKEYRGCANGYYYALIDDEHFIGIDID